MDNNIEFFTNTLTDSLQNNSFVKLTLSKKRKKSSELNKVLVKSVLLKRGMSMSFTYRHTTKDITKNYSFSDGTSIIEELLSTSFFNADLFTSEEDLTLLMNKKNNSRIIKKAASNKLAPAFHHDNVKKEYVLKQDNIYLQELGVLNAESAIKKGMHDKFKQLNKYIEIIDGIIRSAKLPAGFTIVDMGSGKGYLTFVLYDYLKNVLKLDIKAIGVEMRPELVELCNNISAKANFNSLNFLTGSIHDVELPPVDMLIALHACDTATDDAIYRGLKSEAEIIVVAPCCHKQIRRQINPVNDLKAISKFGILKERQTEIITDAIRALTLEAYGYKTKVFEFISTEHTPKNVLIVGIKKKNYSGIDESKLSQIKNIKDLYGIEYHYLEKLLNSSV